MNKIEVVQTSVLLKQLLRRFYILILAAAIAAGLAGLYMKVTEHPMYQCYAEYYYPPIYEEGALTWNAMEKAEKSLNSVRDFITGSLVREKASQITGYAEEELERSVLVYSKADTCTLTLQVTNENKEFTEEVFSLLSRTLINKSKQLMEIDNLQINNYQNEAVICEQKSLMKACLAAAIGGLMLGCVIVLLIDRREIIRWQKIESAEQEMADF